MLDRELVNLTQPARSTMERRSFLKLAAAVGAASVGLPYVTQTDGLAVDAPAASPVPAGAASRPAFPLAKFPEKTELLLLTDRPPNLEMPAQYLIHDLTPNEAFFVRWHLGLVPTKIDLSTYRLNVVGNVQTPLNLSVEELKKNFEPVSVVAVNQCSGNSRSFFEPRVPGGQWANGAIGNAKWTGVRLADLLKKAGVKAGSVDITFGGLDRSPMPTVAPFIKSLPADHPKLAESIVAYAMNDQPLPMLNGFPLRLVVPGWYATYWIKSLSEISVTTEKFMGFWMAKAYRIPTTPNMVETPTELAKETVPIGPMTCRSLFVKPEAGERVPAAKPYEVNGVALDSGKGIAKVEVSVDGGKTWADAKLDPEIGKYSWRRFKYAWTPAAGEQTLMCRATNTAGETQSTSQWNRSGYGRNVVEAVTVTVA